MYSTAIVLALAIGLVSPRSVDDLHTHNLGSVGATSNVGIFDGKTTTITKHAYLVGVLVGGSFYCAGTIVNERWIVTLADCVKDVSAEEVTVVSGSSDGVTGTSHSVEQLIRHPYYGTAKLDYDYALLQISGNFTFSNVTSKAKLPHQETKDNASLTVVGYGSTSTSNERVMLQGTMTWLPKATCMQYYTNFGITWTDRMACAYDEGATTLCKGDYGDPFLKNAVYFGHFIAVASKGFCTSSAKPVILADIFPVASWIRSTIKS